MEKTEIISCEFALFKKNINLVHGIFTRNGGVSTGAFSSLNIGLNSGDDPTAIAENRQRIVRKTGIKTLVFLNQVHGDNIKVIKKGNYDLSERFEPSTQIFAADGLLTDMAGIGLVIQIADCQAVMLYDKKKQIIANIHSGWQGSVKNIIGKCVDKMKSVFNCRPENIIAGISPSLGPCCSQFINYKDEIPEKLWHYKIKDTDNFDFWKMTIDQLMEKGLKKHHIENMKICTKCHTDVFYSFRKEKTTGRFASVISMCQAGCEK